MRSSRLPSIEAALRSAFSWTLVRLFGGRRRVAIPDWRARPYRILFIRDDGIGDLMVSMEVLRAIKEASPTFTLDLLCSPQNAPFGRTLPFVNEVIVHKRGFLLKAIPTWWRLRRREYDVAVDGRVAIGNVNKQTTCLLLSTGAPWRIGIAGRRNDRVYSVPVHLQEIRHWIDAIVALAQPFGIKGDSRDWRARLPFSSEERAAGNETWTRVGAGRPRILVNVSSAQPDRQWPLERFAPVLAKARERLPNATIVISSMPAQQEAAERLAAPVNAAALRMTLSEVKAVTATADLVISPDTAITVIASAFQIPILALMRKGTAQWIPYRAPGRAVFGDDPPTLVGLPSERVVAALDELITELGPSLGRVY
jgi:ADP-heptose:LPS heptosyltransferase